MGKKLYARTGLGVLAVAYIGGVSIYGGQVEAQASRAFASGNYALYLDNKLVGFLKAVSGGDAMADVVQERAVGGLVKLHLGKTRFEEFVLEVPFGSIPALEEWMSTGLGQRKDGSIAAADVNYNIKSSRQFKQALITEIGMPALDAASKDSAYLTVKLAPQSTLDLKGSGALPKPDLSKQKKFLPSNFKLEIDGIDCSRVSKIDAFTVKQSSAVDSIGASRVAVREPGRLEFPNLVISLPSSFDGEFRKWHQDFVINGDNSDARERKGRLFLLDAARQSTLMQLNFQGLGIFKMSADKNERGADKISNVKVYLYCERMDIGVPKKQP